MPTIRERSIKYLGAFVCLALISALLIAMVNLFGKAIQGDPIYMDALAWVVSFGGLMFMARMFINSKRTLASGNPVDNDFKTQYLDARTALRLRTENALSIIRILMVLDVFTCFFLFVTLSANVVFEHMAYGQFSLFAATIVIALFLDFWDEQIKRDRFADQN